MGARRGLLLLPLYQIGATLVGLGITWALARRRRLAIAERGHDHE